LAAKGTDARELQDRWRDAEFVASVRPTLDDVFVRKTASATVDLRGVVVGLDGALPGLVGADLQGVHLRGVDFSFARLSCSMVRGCFDGCLFHSAIFDTCRMTAARFVESWFDEATLDSPWMDDAVFHRCSFAGGRLSGRGMREFGGRRALFEDCDFTGAKLKNMAFRACRFINCRFEGAVFVRCMLVGVKFENGSPARGALSGCDLQRVTVDGGDL